MPGASSLAREIARDLRSAGRPHRAGSVDGHSRSSMAVLGVTVPDLRAVVRSVAKSIRDEEPELVVELAHALVGSNVLEARQVGYELLGRRRDARALLRARDVEALGRGIDNWKSVDVFSLEVSGACWREGRVTDGAVRRWARSRDRWWRRTALVATVPLNMKSRGGEGDAPRTLGICGLLAEDRDDMVVKGLSWALRALAARKPAPVRAFLEEHQASLAPRVLREVRSKLDSGRKNPGSRG